MEGGATGGRQVPGLKSGIELDATDRALIAELQIDGRAPFVELGRRLGLSEKTVRNRVSALLASDVIRIIGLTDPRMLGFEAIAMLGLTTDPAVPASQIAAEIAGIKDVDYVVVTTGRYSIMVEILASDAERLRQVIERQIGPIAGVRSMEIFPCFSLFYQKARFLADGSNSGVRSSPLSELDRRLAMVLNTDGRMPFRAVADRLGISETQVRARVAAMLEVRQLSILAIMNPLAAGRSVAWVGLRLAPGARCEDVAGHLAEDPNVSYVFICGGRFDLFVEVICDSDSQLYSVIETKFRPDRRLAAIELFSYLDLHYKILSDVD